MEKKLKSLAVRHAVKNDCLSMKNIIKVHADDGHMLGKTVSQLISLLPNYFVAELDKKIVGVCGFKIWPVDGVELISSAVISRLHNRGIGKELNLRCIEAGKSLGFNKFFVLTKRVDFYRGLGFKKVPKNSFTSKVSVDCAFCRENRTKDVEKKMIDCDEIGMRLFLKRRQR